MEEKRYFVCDNCGETSCKSSKNVPEYVYLESNAWILNGVVYTTMRHVLDAKKADDAIETLFRKVRNPDFDGPLKK